MRRPIVSFAALAVVTVAFAIALPREARTLRAGALVYLAACAFCLLVPSPIGSNVERYAVLLAAPLLLCARLKGERGRLSPLATLALAGIAVWVLWGPVRETEAVWGNPSTNASFYLPVERFLDRVPGPVRVEVPLTRSHWEAALLAPHVSLARGWEKQLDERYDGELLHGRLTAASYLRWLRREAVAYVALPNVPLDPSSAQEGRLVRSGLSYLRLAFQSQNWHIYEVVGATPLVSGPGRLERLGHDSFVLQAERPGSFLVREHYTRYWALTAGTGCVRPGREGFTEVTASAPGRIVVAARFSLSRALGSRGSCRG